ncbi:UDP-N-acetylmuramoylalanine--D-glutamate ligase [Lachnospiraceae bacterium KH1T2]|nr:UDP-N-acetylmuramoylalanine--D-glutamate ligase [Lachnospiraceae bacterium KH1T2]
MYHKHEYLNGKNILIWGYGREGKATERFIKKFCPDSKYEVFEGKRDGVNADEYDYIFVSPGIPFDEADPKFTSETQVFLEAFRDRTIGITGTKGKSTTSSLLYTALKSCLGHPVCLVGNISVPCLDYYEEMLENPDEVAVFELSCHQCDRLTVSPHIAVFLNLFEDHLDRYITEERYFEAKKGITRNQNSDDVLYVGEEVPDYSVDSKKKVISSEISEHFELAIPGEHNQYNAEFVKRIACDEYGCDEEAVRRAIKAFSGLPHRLEFAGEYNGIRYYDDSISTIPEAAVSACESIPDVKTVLLGGMDRHIDYNVLTRFIPKHPEINFICSYDAGRRIYDETKMSPNLYYKPDLAEAVELAKKITPAGGACVLSPAAASYGYFKNFEERGDVFKGLVAN